MNVPTSSAMAAPMMCDRSILLPYRPPPPDCSRSFSSKARLAPRRTSSSRWASSSRSTPPWEAPALRTLGSPRGSSTAYPAASTRGAVAGRSTAPLRSSSSRLPLSESNFRSSSLLGSRPTHRAPLRLPFAQPFFLSPDFFYLPPAALTLFMAFPTALRVTVLTTAFTTTFPIPPMLPTVHSFRRFCAKESGPHHGTRLCVPRSSSCPRGLVMGALESSTRGGLVLHVYLLAPYVFLDRLGVFDHVLAHADLFLDVRALAHHDLFLGDGNDHLVLADLGLGGLA